MSIYSCLLGIRHTELDAVLVETVNQGGSGECGPRSVHTPPVKTKTCINKNSHRISLPSQRTNKITLKPHTKLPIMERSMSCTHREAIWTYV